MRSKNYFCRWFIICCFLFSFQKIKAQVILQDSLALVALYNAQPLMGDSTWLHGNVSSWTGITVEGKRVVEFQVNYKTINDVIPQEICGLDTLNFLSLEFNQFRGLVPSCIIDMPYLKHLGLSYNELTGMEVGTDFSHMNAIYYIGISNNIFSEMPDFISIPSPIFEALNVSYNGFNFDDLLPILTKPTVTIFTYHPQYNIGVYHRMDVSIGDTVNFPDVSSIAGGTGNSYNWVIEEGLNAYNPPEERFKNINTSAMRAEDVQLSDTKLYRCDITNPNLPGLTLSTTQYDLHVTDPLLPQTITYTGDTIAYCADSLLRLSATTTSGNGVSFVSLADGIATVNPDHTLNIYRPGIVTIQATVPTDGTYHADTLLIPITVTSHLSVPTFFPLDLQLPNGEGEDLKYTLPYYPGLTYHWTLPNGQTRDSSSLTISPFTVADIGIYDFKITEGTCIHGSGFHHIYSFPYGKPTVYELITPNGDGDNETFYIENLNPALHNEVSVFNASHQVVFHEENYRNNWSGEALPVGTYYYLVRVGENTYKGNLYIKR